MGTTHINTRAVILGITLGLLAIPFFIDSLSGPHFSGAVQDAPLEFTDVRIVRPDLSVPYSESEIIQRVTIHSEFSFNSPWCQWNDPMALPCPQPLWDLDNETHDKPLMIHKAIPSL